MSDQQPATVDTFVHASARRPDSVAAQLTRPARAAVPGVEQTMAAGAPSPTEPPAAPDPAAVAIVSGRDGSQVVQLERASDAAPRPELDWTRDWQGRPRILPDPTWTPEQVSAWADGRANDQGEVPYTRVTTYAEALQDASALTRWKQRRVLLGASRRPDYVIAAAALTTEDRDREALDDLAEKCLEAAGPNAADVGTALHGFTERIDRGEELGVIPEQYLASIDAYRRVVSHLTFVEYECRTVCDQLEVAGTPDRVGFCDVPDPDGNVDLLRIIDTKTGRVDYSAGKFSTQLAIYAHSDLYHPGTGARTSWQERHGAELSLRWGLLVHMPAGADTAELLWIKLDHGWAGALEAGKVRHWRTEASAGNLLVPVFARAPRPATTDGTCRGRLGSGKPCTYRAKVVDGERTQWCGRHQDQRAGLERWLAENPGADPDAGEETQPRRDPVQPASGVGAASAVPLADAYLQSMRAVDPTPDPNLTGSVVEEAEPPEERCPATDLLVDQCACVEHRPDLTTTAAVIRVMAGEQPLPAEPAQEPACLWAHGPVAGLDEHGRCRICAEPDEPEETARELPELTPAQQKTLHDAAVNAADDQYRRQLQDARQAVGTYALDPATEVNGNPRPRSGLATPEDAGQALRSARAGLFDLIDACQTETELRQLYQAHAGVWHPHHTDRAAARSAAIADRQRRERPEAALLVAITSAPDLETLDQLWATHGRGPGRTGLWTQEHTDAALQRRNQLLAALEY